MLFRLFPAFLRKPRLPVILLSFLAGLVFPLALAPWSWWPVALLSIAINFYLVAHHSPSGRQAFITGWAYGAGVWFTGAFWLYTSIHQFGNTPAPLAVLLVWLLALMMGIFNGLQALAFFRLSARFPDRVPNLFSFSLLWMLADWLKTWVFTGFPWLFAGYAFTDTLLAHLAALGGVHLVTGVVVLLSAVLAELTRMVVRHYRFPTTLQPAPSPLPSRFYLTILAGIPLLSWPVYSHQWTQKLPVPALTTSLIQGNIPQNLKWLLLYRQKTLDIYQNLSTSEWGRELVVWPEASIPMLQTDAKEFIFRIRQTALTHKSTWVTGVPWEDFSEPEDASGYHPFYNAIMSTGYEGSGIYKKQRLVPVGEYTPLRGWINWMLPELAKNGHDFSPGASRQQPLKVHGYRLGAAICYEVAYPQITRRNALNTHFMITISNDAWFDGSDGPAQHLQMVQMRAIETGRWFIRATNTGITAFISPKGKLARVAPGRQATILRGDLPPYQGSTPYMQLGEWPAYVLFGMLALFFHRRMSTSHPAATGKV